VTNLVNLLNPEVVLFGGILRDLLPVLEPLVREALDLGLPGPRAQVRLEVPGLGADSNLVGAAELVFETLLLDPLAVLAVAAGRGVPAVPARLGADRSD
jgi:predicted NBD/HSP70 family sugar kinase